MKSFCERVIEDLQNSARLGDLHERGWYSVTGKAGPNAVLKIVIPPSGGDQGYVLTIARHADTAVVRHEIDILNRLRQTLPGGLTSTIPEIAAHGRIDDRAWFAVPFYGSVGVHRITRRLARNRRNKWVTHWVTDLGRHTLGPSLSPEWLEVRYADTIRRVEQDPAVSEHVKSSLRESFQTVFDRARQIPTVCCHGDLWSGNILWQRGFRSAVVLDWGAAQWPGLPAVDLCRYALGNFGSNALIAEVIGQYCRAINLDPTLVPPLYDLYNVFIKSELDLAYAAQPHLRYDPFTAVSRAPSQSLAQLMAAC